MCFFEREDIADASTLSVKSWYVPLNAKNLI